MWTKNNWNALFSYSNSSCFKFSFNSSIVAKRRKKVGEGQVRWIRKLRHDYGFVFVQKIDSHTSIDVYAGALSWCKVHDCFFHNSVCFWRIHIIYDLYFSFIGVFSFGKGKCQPGPSPVNTMVVTWLRFCFCPKTHAQASMCKQFDDYAKFFSSLLQCFHQLLTGSDNQDKHRHWHLLGLP